MATVPERIRSFNKGRIPELLNRKYSAMRLNSFSFFRGSCHLFYEDLHQAGPIKDKTHVWICGDLHLENFGTFKGNNRAVYFDLNDFDEAIQAPASWEVVRALSSIYLAAGPGGFNRKKAAGLCQTFLSTYVTHLTRGKDGFIEKDVVQGIVRKFLISLRLRQRSEFIDSRTVVKKGKRRLIIDNKKTLELSPGKKKQLTDFMDEWRGSRPDRKFFKVIDAAFRIAGTGSLGVERYALLVRGHGPGNNYLLDMKTASPSCLTPYVKVKQPHWNNEAERITQIQYRSQAVPPALLSDVNFNGRHFILKELQPTQDKMRLTLCKGKRKKLEEVIVQMAHMTASAQIRSGGRQGSSIADELIAFSKQKEWQKQVLQYASAYSLQVEKDFAEYCKAYDAGFFGGKKKTSAKKTT